MLPFVFASAAVLVLGLIPAAGFAASTVPKPTTTDNPSVILVQGWWEHEHMERRARDGIGACRLQSSTATIAFRSKSISSRSRGARSMND